MRLEINRTSGHVSVKCYANGFTVDTADLNRNDPDDRSTLITLHVLLTQAADKLYAQMHEIDKLPTLYTQQVGRMARHSLPKETAS